MRQTLALCGLLASLAVAGCGGSDEADDKVTIGKATPSADATSAKGDDVPKPSSIEEAKGLHASVLGTSVADTEDEKAAVEAWIGYWQATADTNFSGTPSPDLDQWSRGEARDDVVAYTADLVSRGEKLVGWTRFNVQSVDITGDTAVLTDCAEDYSFTVDTAGTPTEEVKPFFQSLATLQRVDGAWQVAQVKSTYVESACL